MLHKSHKTRAAGSIRSVKTCRHTNGPRQCSGWGALRETFPKLKKLTEDLAEIAAALRLSPDLILTEDGTLIKSAVDHLKDINEPGQSAWHKTKGGWCVCPPTF